MYLEHLVPSVFAVFSSPHCFIKRLFHRRLVSFGLFANLDYLRKRGAFADVNAVVDIGANIGQFAFMINSVLPNIPIFSFEPDPNCASGLQETFHKFGIPGRCFSFALSSEEGGAELNIYESSANNSMLPRHGEIPKVVQPVTCRTLDSIRDEFGPSKSFLLKIDVQGAELSVLEGARLFLRDCKIVMLEVSLTAAYSGNAKIEDVIGFMRSAGFIFWEITDVLRRKRPNDLGMLEMDILFVRR